MKRVKEPQIQQHYKYDCGAACLVSVAAFYGIKASLARTRILCGCTPDGISIQGILDGASKLGLDAKGYKSPDKKITPLMEIDAPFIAHINSEDGFLHFVVVYKTGKLEMRIMDPANGKLENMATDIFTDRWTGYIIIITPSFAATNAADSTISPAGAIWGLAKQNARELTLAFAGSIICTAAGISTTFLLQQTIDTIVPQGDTVYIILLGTIVFSITFASLYVGYAASRYLIRSSLKIETSLIAAYMEKLRHLPAEFFTNYRSGDLSSRMEDIHSIRSFITTGAVGILTSIITIMGALGVMFFYNVKLSFLIALSIPAYWALYKISGYLNRKYSRETATAKSSFDSALIEGISTSASVRHYGAHSLAWGKMEQCYVTLAECLNRSANAVNIFSVSVQGVSRVLLCIILTAGSAALLNGEMSIGELVGFYSLCSFFTVPMDELIGTNELIARTSVACNRIFEILSLAPEEGEQEGLATGNISGNLVIEGVNFRFPGREPLMENLTLTAKEGEITLIRGESGCGKSTLAALILRDYLPLNGSISYGGVNINQFNLPQWREIIGYVPQRPHLFNASILENITLGEKDPDIKRVLEICSRLNMLRMIKRFPQGLLTGAGNTGEGLSGGECQKICIARALYRNPRIYILDEATSALDAESEKCLLKILQRLKMDGKTIIFISHKQENSKIADNVVDIN